ncbi:MAG: serine hydrolase, partial [bacterium]|nr:serine hydrolase [bacterium]
MREKDMNLLKLYLSAVLLLCAVLFFSGPLFAQAPVNRGEGSAGKDFSMEEVDQTVRQLMEEGDIPGLMLVLVKGDGKIITRGYGYANLEQKRRVTGDTLFELASVSKAFTALAALQCEEKGLFNLDDGVSEYLPWFYVNYEGMKTGITIRQLLHQTSGIPFNSVSLIPQSSAPDALEKTVRNLVGIELDTQPGKAYQYATINYDVVAAVIQTVTNRPFEDYMKENVLVPLGMGSTQVGVDKSDPNLSSGHKISFFAPREYDAPVYRGNNAAGYIVSNGKDIARWLQYQMGARETGMKSLIEKSRLPDTTVPPNPRDRSSYCMGWFSYFNENDIVDHAGMNPNFSTYMAVSPKEKIGVAVLANSNSNHTRNIGYYAINVLRNIPGYDDVVRGDNIDKGGSVFSFLMSLYILCTVVFILSIFYDLIKGRRRFEGLSLKKLGKFAGTLVLLLPFIYAIYLIPMAMRGVSWQTTFAWSPGSFKVAIFLALGSIGLSYAAYVISSLFPQKNKYIRSMPLVIILSLLAGFANAMVIFLITTALFTQIALPYQLYFFVLAFLVYILGRKVLQTKLIRITFDIVYDMRIKLIDKIFHTSYQRFENLDRGRILATLNDDTAQVGEAANIAVRIVTSGITVFGAFLYLATIAFWATMVTTGVVGVIAILYAVVTQRTRVFF